MKKKNGITLVALVLTIIVLIILTSVSLNILLGNDGLLSKARLAKESYTNATNDEEEKLKNLESLFSKILVSSNSTVELSMEQLNEYIDQRVNQKLSETNTSNPTGTIIAYSVNNVPNGYLKCEGQAVSRIDYANLFSIIGTTYGSGDGSTTFNVPDLRGEFLRGAGNNSNTTQGNGGTVGEHQDATLINNSWISTTDFGMLGSSSSQYAENFDKEFEAEIGRYASGSPMSSTSSRKPNGKFTSRPTNTSVLYCIKY